MNWANKNRFSCGGLTVIEVERGQWLIGGGSHRVQVLGTYSDAMNAYYKIRDKIRRDRDGDSDEEASDESTST